MFTTNRTANTIPLIAAIRAAGPVPDDADGAASLAGAALTGFAGGLLGLYWRTPGLRKPGSVWPTQQGLGVSKDVWMLGIGAGLLTAALKRRRG